MPRRFSSAKTVGIGSGKGFDESSLAMVDMAGGTDDNISHARRLHRSIAMNAVTMNVSAAPIFVLWRYSQVQRSTVFSR